MRQRKLPDSRIATALALTLLFSACLKTPPPGVQVGTEVAGLVFGVPPLPEPVFPAAFEEPPVEEAPSPKPLVKPPPPPPPKIVCPTAKESAQPEREADTSVVGLPAEGLYRWKFKFAATNTAGETETGTDLTGFYKGIGGIRRLSATTAPVISSRFTVGEYQLRGRNPSFVLTEFEVRQNQPPQTSDGIFLTRIDRVDLTTGEESPPFQPDNGVKFLPLPVKQGDPVLQPNNDANVGIDPNTQQVLKLTGTVAKRHRVDVCGTIIDSWLVEATMEFIDTAGNAYQIKYDYSIATQFGGWIAYEHIESPETNPSVIIDQNVGELEPSRPLPSEFRF